MSKIRYAALCSLLLSNIAPFAWSQREARSTQTPQVLLNVIVLELHFTEGEKNHFLKEFADSSEKEQRVQQGFMVGLVTQSESAKSLLNRMHSRRVAEFISTPKMLTQSGQSASCFVGQQIPLSEESNVVDEKGRKVKFRDVGHKVTMLPMVNEKGKIRLTMTFSHSEVSSKVPADITEMKFNATAEMEKGQTIFLLAPKTTVAVSTDADGRQVYLLHMVTANIVSQ